MPEELKLFESVATLASHAGPWGIAGYLLWRDLIQPRQNGKRNGNGGSKPAAVALATEADVSSLGQSFRDFRAEINQFRTEIWDRVTDISDRVARVEGRLEGK